jgi:hypothetical protein
LPRRPFSQQRIIEYLPWTLQAFHDPVRLEGHGDRAS